MSNFNKPRVKRGPAPKKPIKRRKHRDALPELLRDFEGRCAYSMQHQSHSGPLEVDHFDPRQKKSLIQDYNNLFPASRHCNGKKSDTWPTRAEFAAGCRFLNPCKEMDYGEQIFENPDTHELIGVTTAARWHIRVCGLNADHLVQERRRRARHWQTIKGVPVKIKGDCVRVADLIENYREQVELMIPEIPPAPLI
jgi:hypothetical protein